MDNGKKLELLKDKVKDLSMIGKESLLVDADLVIDLIDKTFSKPVIPKLVAEHIEKWKHEGLIITEWFTFDYDNEDENKVAKWLYNNDDETNKRREFMLIDAIRYGYEVEKEKEHYDYNRDGCEVQKEKKYYVFDNRDDSYLGFNGERTKLEWHYHTVNKESFTEAEIKAIDARYWVFAQEVTK